MDFITKFLKYFLYGVFIDISSFLGYNVDSLIKTAKMCTVVIYFHTGKAITD